MKTMITIQHGPVKDGPALDGGDIGYYYAGIKLDVNEQLEHDKWVPVVGPNDLGPTWRKTGKQGWVEKAHLRPESAEEQKFLLTIRADGTYSLVRLE